MTTATYEAPQSVVMQRVLANYGHASIRPGVWKSRGGAPFEQDVVEIQYGVDQFSNLFQRTQTWGVAGYFRTWWHDPRLAFNATEAGTDRISLPLADQSKIWQPHTYLEMVQDWSGITDTDGFSEGLWIYSDGRVWRSQQRRATLACTIDLSQMPYDTQSCQWKMGMYTELAHEVQIKWRANNGTSLDAFDRWGQTCPSGWTPTAMSQADVVESWPSGSYSYAVANVDFTRKDAEELYFSYAGVAFALVGLSYLGFFINPAATPARVALGIIGILAVLSNRNALIATMPPGASDVWLSNFLTICLVFNLVAFTEQVAVNFGRAAHEYVTVAELERKANAALLAAAETAVSACGMQPLPNLDTGEEEPDDFDAGDEEETTPADDKEVWGLWTAPIVHARSPRPAPRAHAHAPRPRNASMTHST